MYTTRNLWFVEYCTLQWSHWYAWEDCCEFPQTKIRDEKVFGYQPQGGGGGGGNHNSSFRFRLLHSSDSKAALNCVVVGLFPHPSDIRTEEKKFSRGSCDNLKVQI